MAFIKGNDNNIITISTGWNPEEITDDFVQDNPDGREPNVALFGGARLSEVEDK